MCNGSDNLRHFSIVSDFGLTRTTNDHELVDSRGICLGTLRSNPKTRTNWVVWISRSCDVPWAFLRLREQIRHFYTGRIGELEELGRENAQPLDRVHITRALKTSQTARENNSSELPRRVAVFDPSLLGSAQARKYGLNSAAFILCGMGTEPRETPGLRTSLPGHRSLRLRAIHIQHNFSHRSTVMRYFRGDIRN